MMTTAVLLNQIYHLPVSERMLIVERTVRSIRRDEKELLSSSQEKERPAKKPVFGCAKGCFQMADDFNAPLEDFKEYM
jgi:hypothetical protein